MVCSSLKYQYQKMLIMDWLITFLPEPMHNWVLRATFGRTQYMTRELSFHDCVTMAYHSYGTACQYI